MLSLSVTQSIDKFMNSYFFICSFDIIPSIYKNMFGETFWSKGGREYIATFGVTCITCNFDDWIDRLAIVTTSRGFKIAWCISHKYFVRGLNFGFFSCSSWTKFMSAHCSKFRETISCWNCLETLPTEKSPGTFLDQNGIHNCISPKHMKTNI